MGERPTIDQAKDFVKEITKQIDTNVECKFSDVQWFDRDVLLVWFKKGQDITKEPVKITIEDVVFDAERHDRTRQKINSAIANLGPKSRKIGFR